MNTSIRIIILLLISTLIFACNDNDDSIKIIQNNLLIGSWINPTNTGIDSEIKYERSNSLKENQYGISFLTQNVFIERSSGWCGTPPLVFDNYQGTWERKNSIIDISINNGFDGLSNIQWKIKSLDEKHLILKIVN